MRVLATPLTSPHYNLRTLAKDESNAEAQRDLSIALEWIGDVKLGIDDVSGASADTCQPLENPSRLAYHIQL
jgi:hypothetical protein